MSMGIAMPATAVRLPVLTLLLLPAALIPSQARANNYTASNDWSVAATFEGEFST
jgi:hypothetical protein